MNNTRGEVHDLLLLYGYRLVEDDWSNVGRRSYVHDDGATRSQFVDLKKGLLGLGWKIDTSQLRSFINAEIGEIIELEPGGSQTTGHFLHHMILR